MEIAHNSRTSQSGLNFMRCFASKLWQIIQLELKNSVSIEISNEKYQKVEVKISVSHTYII